MTLQLILRVALKFPSISPTYELSLAINGISVSTSNSQTNEMQHLKLHIILRTLRQTTENLGANIQLIGQSQQQLLEYYNEIERPTSGAGNDHVSHYRPFTESRKNQTLHVGGEPTEQSNNGNTNGQSLSSSSTETKASASAKSSLDSEFINILLLGESGVGKSTFINAFVNYLTFNTLEEAESNKPLALIPVSFLMTTGDNFTEHTVKLEVSDLSNNEDFQHPGQSVTQRCRSYVFQLKHQAGKKLRIIDTPGFGDTRGLAQDDLNMQHILEYINQFTHLNAVCFLLKPNESRLNIYFRTCLIQLFDFLGTDVRQNIIFCFTNSRPTFYTPGDTAPLLKAMLQSISPANIPFEKKNAYCFDSESFRYLIALKHGITFDNQERCEYEASWVKSVTEFNRLLNNIQQNTVVYHLNDSCKSIKQAQLQIIQMIRPMLESVRNCLRNITLQHEYPPNKSIAMKPRSLSHPINICLSCDHELYQIAHFYFSSNCEHNIQDNKHKCSDASNQHLTINYVLDYDTSSDQSTLNENELFDQMSLLIDAGATFSSFLMFNAADPKTDLFLTGLTRMRDEEKNIHFKRNQKSGLNQQLSEELQIMSLKYMNRLNEVQHNVEDNEPSTIYSLIKIIQDIPEIHIQLEAVRKTHQNMMKKYDYGIPSGPTYAIESQPLSF